jgi:hypothetical protein
MVGPFRQNKSSRGLVVGDDTFSVPVIGTMYHQMTLGALSAARTVRGHSRYCAALLTVSTSLRDTRAVVVSINGLEVGHLESEHTQSFEYALAPANYTDAACEAEIVTGWKSYGDRGYVGVRLNAKLPFEVISPALYPPQRR